MRTQIKKFSKWIVIVMVAYIAILIGGFFGVKYGLTNTAGVVDNKSGYFQKASDEISGMEKIEQADTDDQGAKSEIAAIKNTNYCEIKAIGLFAPANASRIVAVYTKTGSDALAAKMILAVNLRLQENTDFQAMTLQCQSSAAADQISLADLQQKFGNNAGNDIFPWMNTPEWQTIKDATLKDKDAINKAGAVAGVEPRLIVASMIVEQLRLFNSEREVFKKFFEPLKILGNADKISLGVMGIKEATAIQIENHLKDPSSPYYLGSQNEHLLDFTTNEPVQERFARLTDEKNNHYYSYLYGALYLKEMMEQWRRAGFDIQYRTEIVGTLFNVGFPQSKPNASPKVGGSAIDVGNGKYSFGSLAYEFYYSGELADDFPYIIK